MNFRRASAALAGALAALMVGPLLLSSPAVAEELTVTFEGPSQTRYAVATTYRVKVQGGTTSDSVKLTVEGGATNQEFVEDITHQNGEDVAIFSINSDSGSLLSAGSYALTFTYLPQGGDDTGSTSTTLEVLQAKTRPIEVTVLKMPRSTRTGKFRIEVPPKVSGDVTGKVKMYFKRSGKTKKSALTTLTDSVAIVKNTPKLKKGTWKMRVKFMGGANWVSSSTTSKLVVKK